MLLVFLYLAIFSLGLCSSVPGKLREFFNSVKEIAPEAGTEPGTEIAKTITESAIRYANNDGRPLDNFINVLLTVCNNGVSKTSLDKIVWDALGQLYPSSRAQRRSRPHRRSGTQALPSQASLRSHPMN